MIDVQKPKLKSYTSLNVPPENIFNPFLVGNLNINDIGKQDVFKDLSIFNECLLNESASAKHQRIFDFLDETLEIKDVNIK